VDFSSLARDIDPVLFKLTVPEISCVSLWGGGCGAQT
jgi:hypothetical protein